MSNEPLNVFVSLDLLRLVDINEPDCSIEMQFEIMLKRKEHRVKYNNLKKIDALNSLTEAVPSPFDTILTLQIFVFKMKFS